MIQRGLAGLICGLIDLFGIGELVNYLLNRRLIGRRSVVNLKGQREDIDTYEFTETKVIKRGVLCFRQTVLSIYDETKNTRTLIKQTVTGEEQVDCAESLRP